MKKEKNVWAITFLIAFWWVSPKQISAQQDSTRLIDLEEVVVTATKFAKAQGETGKVLTIIDENQIKQSSGKDISQLLNEQAGLFINGANSSPGKDKSVYLRGARSEYTVILLDGIPINDPSGIGGGAYDLRLISIDQIERIEILKGNQSTLYGSNAIAGVINIITKKEGKKPISGSGTASLGSFNTLFTSANVSGSTKKLDYLIGGSRTSTGGISEAKDTLNSNFEKDGFTRKAINASLTYKPFEKLHLQPFFRYSEFDGSYDGGAFMDSPGNTYTSTFKNIGTSIQYKLDKGSIQMLYGYDNTHREFVDGDFNFTLNYQGQFHHGEGYFNYDMGKYIQVLTGLSWQLHKLKDVMATAPNPNMTLTSPYISLFLRNLNGISAEFGGRFNSHSTYGNNFSYSFNPSYLFHNKLKIFLNLSSGFKAPSLQQLYGQFGSNVNLKPETSQGFDGGVQLFINSKFDFRVVAFKRKVQNVIFYSSNGYINLNEQNDKGLDVEGSFSPIRKLNIKTFYSFVDGFLISSGNETDNLFRIPKSTFGFNVGFKILPDWLVSLNYKYTGKRDDLFFNINTFTSDRVRLDAFHLVDFYSEYSLWKGRTKFFVDIKNILNQDYYEVYGYSVLPTTVNGGLSVSF